MRTIYFEPGWYIRELDRVLIEHPPRDYRFVVRRHFLHMLVQSVGRGFLPHRIYGGIRKLMPVELAKAWLEMLYPPPADVVLTYSFFHLVLRREPWVLEIPCEQPHLLIGRENHFYTWKPFLRRLLESSHCRAIICRAEAVKEALIDRLGGNDAIGDKVYVIYAAAPVKPVSNKPDKAKISLLFVNSIHLNLPETFYGKGGLILLEAFRRLLLRYPNLELVLRSKVPRRVLHDYADVLRSVHVLQDPLTQQDLEKLWMSADIFVLPSYVTPDATLIEAMSYGLPVVTTDVWANPEIVVFGETGLLISSPHLRRFADGRVIHTEHADWGKHIRILDNRMVDELEEKLSILIEREDLRREMGIAARREVVQGRFSIHRRNEELKRVLDEVTSS